MRVEQFQLGAHVVAHNVASGAILLNDAVGAKALEACVRDIDHLSTPSVPGSLRALWDAAGILKRARFEPGATIALSREAEPFQLAFGLEQRTVCVDVPDRQLTDQLQSILAPYLVSTGLGESPRLRLARSDEEFTVYDSDQPLTEIVDRDQARFLLIRRITEILLGEHRVAATLHASAVERNGRCLILTGDSGRGKTTTALGLLHAGCAQVADDHLALDCDGRDALPFPAAVGLKPGAVPLPEAQALLRAGAETAPVRDAVRYIHPPDRVHPGTQLPIAAIVIPHFIPGAGFDLERITPEDALVALFAAGARLSPGLNSIKPMARLLNATPVFTMTYGHSDQSIPACLSLLDAPC